MRKSLGLVKGSEVILEKGTIEILTGNVGTGKSTRISNYIRDNLNDKHLVISSKENADKGLFTCLMLDKSNPTTIEDVSNFFKNKTPLFIEYNLLKELGVLYKYDFLSIVMPYLESDWFLFIDGVCIQDIIKTGVEFQCKVLITAYPYIKKENILEDFKNKCVITDYNYYDYRDEAYSGNISLRVPKSLHKRVSIDAEKEGVSLNQYIMYLLAKYKNI